MRSPAPQGQIILLALVFFAVFLSITTALIGYVLVYNRTERQAVADRQALALAEAGIDEAAYQLNQNSSYTGEADTALGNGTFTVTVASVDASTKQVSVTGYVPNRTNPLATKTVAAKLAINSSVVSFRFGVQVGQGGVEMDNNSRINGNLYTNGNVSGSGFVTGDVTVAGGTQSAADQQWTTQNGGVNLGDASARAALAQEFKPTATNVLNKVSLYLRKVGNPSDITLKLVSDNSGKPSNTVLASGSVAASTVTGSYSFIDGTFTSTPTLTKDTPYWVIAVASMNSSNYFVWGSDTLDGYASGTAKSSSNWSVNNASWAALGNDLDFETWMGGVVTSLSGIHVGGTAWAHALSGCTVDGNAIYQTISSCSVAGTKTVSATDAAPSAAPISDAQIAGWESAATAGGVVGGNYTVSGSQTIGPKEIDGDLTVNGTLYLSGPIWVKGNITFGINSGLVVAPAVGNSAVAIIANDPGLEATKGVVTLANNMTISGNGNSNSYPMVLSTNTGTAITLNNNADSVILYAPDGTITVANNATANQITAKTLHLSNNVIVDYVSGLQSQSFSNGPGGSWAFVAGTYAIMR